MSASSSSPSSSSSSSPGRGHFEQHRSKCPSGTDRQSGLDARGDPLDFSPSDHDDFDDDFDDDDNCGVVYFDDVRADYDEEGRSD